MTAAEFVDALVPLLTDAPIVGTDPVLVRDSHGELFDVTAIDCGPGGRLVMDITLTGVNDPDGQSTAGETTALTVDAERARIRRAVADACDLFDPANGAIVPAVSVRGVLAAVLTAIDDAREVDNPPALTPGDLHELAEYAEHDAAMFEAGDHRADEEPHEWFIEEAARLRALAGRARAHLGSPPID